MSAALAAALVVTLWGCAAMPAGPGSGVALGDSRAHTLQRAGRPTAQHALPDGVRLQYSGQPAGAWVYNLDFDRNDRLQRVEQALQPELFARIVVGLWRRDDVLREYGQPARVERVARFDGDIWTYLFHDIGFPRWLHVHLDPAGVVRQILTLDAVDAPSDREP